MGESFFCTSFFETKSGKRATYFEPVPSCEFYLERLFFAGKRLEQSKEVMMSRCSAEILVFAGRSVF